MEELIIDTNLKQNEEIKFVKRESPNVVISVYDGEGNKTCENYDPVNDSRLKMSREQK